MYLRTGKHSIRRVENSGKNITLEDGSRWEVSLIDKIKSMLWLPIDEVVVESYMGSKCKITNTKRKETVEATHLG